VYGANARANYFTGSAEGFSQQHGAGTIVAPLFHGNGHIYANNVPANAYSTATKFFIEPNEAMQLEPGITVHIQAYVRFLKQVNAGVGTGPGRYTLSATFWLDGETTNRGPYNGASPAMDIPEAGQDWRWVSTRDAGGSGWVVPDQKNPVGVTLKSLYVSAFGTTGALGPFNEYQFWCDQILLVDQNGTLLKRVTVAPVERLKAYDGSAWV
jgi:hypothetical protein